tara:strand:+ start:274 stop:999 length:726 start_codon:yes stop_codon:yes gene_type:complete
MAGHSHWAGIKHKKGRQDKIRAKLFSKLSREITVAAKLGAKDPESNPRLRTAIQLARQSNMPKDNIERAINKSEANLNENFQNLRYEGYGPFNVALIIETLSDNKNRSASSIRTILSRNGGRLGENGSTKHLFFNCGIIQVNRKALSDEEVLESAILFGAKDCKSFSNIHEIVTEKEDFYKIKNLVETKTDSIKHTGIEWRPKSYIDLSKTQNEKIIKMLEDLDDEDDIQNTFTNCKLTIN